jgi:F1F0 ATPase subunit 2
MIDLSILSLERIGSYGVALVGGLFLGLFFYGGLWWTVNRLPTSGQPALLAIGSFVVRTSLTVLGFYLIMDGQIDRIVVSVIGFLLVRTLLVRRLGPASESVETGKENVHADQSR